MGEKEKNKPSESGRLELENTIELLELIARKIERWDRLGMDFAEILARCPDESRQSDYDSMKHELNLREIRALEFAISVLKGQG